MKFCSWGFIHLQDADGRPQSRINSVATIIVNDIRLNLYISLTNAITPELDFTECE
jgi:hypothetical protein